MRRDPAGVGSCAMLKQKNTLPRAQCEAALGDRDRQMGGQKRRLDVGGHIVGAFIGVRKIRHRRIGRGGHKAVKEVLQIGLHLGVRVFLNQKRT